MTARCADAFAEQARQTPHTHTLPQLSIPAEVNYIGAFLTLECNLACAYCINDPSQAGCRKGLFAGDGMSPSDWVRGLARLPVSADLPITLQGGEPMIYRGGRGVADILAGSEHWFDLLTNLVVKSERVIEALAPNAAKLRRQAPYPSVRVSYHPAEHQRLWGAGALGVLAERCRRLAEAGLRVSRVKSEADVGIYMVAHPDNHADATEAHRRDVFFETKEFLGIHDKRLYGSYLYPYSTDLIASGVSPSPLYCECRTTELLIDPMGFVWSCHFHLYSRWKHGGGTAAEYGAIAADGFRWRERMGEAKVAGILGHILDPDFTLAELRRFRACGSYGLCVGCDTKVKNDRFQSLSDRSRPHTSVEIRALSAPQSIRDRMGERCAVSPFAEFEDL